MGKYKKIYVLAPFGHSTGGVELAHQLVDYLRNKNLEAYIVYVAKGDKVISMISPLLLIIQSII